MGVYNHSGLSLTTEPFYITITKNADGTYSADKYHGEIETAYNEGHMLYCVGDMIVPLVDVTEDGTFNFACPTPDGMICGFVLKGNPNGTVNVTYKESSGSNGGSGATQEQLNQIAKNTQDISNLSGQIPTKTSQLTNDSGFLTQHQDLSAYAKTSQIPTKTSQLTNDSNFVTKEVTDNLQGQISDLGFVPQAVIEGASTLVNKALSRGNENVIRFPVFADAHQLNGNELITKGNRELGQALGEVVNLIGVDFVASLGDNAWGSEDNTVEEVVEQLKTFNRFARPYLKGEEEINAEGNHDDAYYSTETYPDTPKLTPSAVYSLIYRRNNDVVFDSEHWIDGYCYKDFEHLKTRVIFLNTEQGDGDGATMEGYQLKWFAETALNMSGKTDWNVITLAHHPLDYGLSTLFKDCVNIIDAFINGDNFSYNTHNDTPVSIAIDFSDKNCQYVGHFHGHTHAYCIVRMQKITGGVFSDIKAWQIGIPNACYSRNNSNLGSTIERLARFSTPTTYNKNDMDGQRTSFNLISIDLDNKIIYADNYGVGIDRQVSYLFEDTVYTITRNLTNCTSSNSSSEVTEGTSHSEKLTANNGYTMDGATVTVTMGGDDITSYYSGGVLNIANVTGDIVVTAIAVEEVVEPSYTNQLPISTDLDGSVYNGKGFKEETYLSSGNPSARAGIITTGFIPVPDLATDYSGGKVILHFANTELTISTDTRMAFYKDDKTYLGQNYATNWQDTPTDANDNATYTLENSYVKTVDISDTCNYYKASGNGVVAFIRLCGKGIDSESIITVNEEIS